MEDTTELKIVESIRDHVYMLRGEQVMIDSDLADIYGYELKAMNQQVKRNIIGEYINSMNEKEFTECQLQIKKLREQSGMNRKEFCEYFKIPYRTVTEWERGTRNAPEYVLRLLAYYLKMESLKQNKENGSILGDSGDMT